jgi:hypothetical protein
MKSILMWKHVTYKLSPVLWIDALGNLEFTPLTDMIASE